MSDHFPSFLSEGPHHSSRSPNAFPAGTVQNWMLITAPDGAVRYGEFRARRDPSVVIARSVPLPARVLPRSPVGRRGSYIRLSVQRMSDARQLK